MSRASIQEASHIGCGADRILTLPACVQARFVTVCVSIAVRSPSCSPHSNAILLSESVSTWWRSGRSILRSRIDMPQRNKAEQLHAVGMWHQPVPRFTYGGNNPSGLHEYVWRNSGFTSKCKKGPWKGVWGMCDLSSTALNTLSLIWYLHKNTTSSLYSVESMNI